MNETPEPATEGEITSTVASLASTPMADLNGSAAAGTKTALDRLLELEADGLLTVASFNASI